MAPAPSLKGQVIMADKDYLITIRYLAAKAEREGGRLILQDAVEFHEALIMQLQTEALSLSKIVEEMKEEIEELKK
jgi:hypothetical protein